MSRRSKGDGAVFREGDGWVARVEIPHGPDGKRRRIKRRAKTQAEARRKLRQLKDDLEASINPDGERRTVAQATDAYLAVLPVANRSAKTIEMYQWRGGIIKTGLGRRRLGELSVKDCDSFLVAAAAGEYGTRTIGRDGLSRIRSLLINVLRNEMRVGNLRANTAELSVMPNLAGPYDRASDDDDGDRLDSIRRTLTHEEFRRLWRVCRSPLIVAVELSGRNGLRPSEARGLRWACVDLDEQTITINRQMNSRNRLTAPKTKRSRRTIPIDDLTVECLAGWLARQEAQRQRAGDLWQDDPALVLSTRYGTAINASNLRRMVTAACEESAVERIVPYELRHTAITFQLDLGHPAWKVADWAGTSERMIEEIYRHRLSRVSDLGSVQVPVWE